MTEHLVAVVVIIIIIAVTLSLFFGSRWLNYHMMVKPYLIPLEKRIEHLEKFHD